MIVVDVVVVVIVVVVPLFEFGNHEVANSIALNVRVYSKKLLPWASILCSVPIIGQKISIISHFNYSMHDDNKTKQHRRTQQFAIVKETCEKTWDRCSIENVWMKKWNMADESIWNSFKSKEEGKRERCCLLHPVPTPTTIRARVVVFVTSVMCKERGVFVACCEWIFWLEEEIE